MDRSYLMDCLCYDCESGIFTWKIKKSGSKGINNAAGGSNGRYMRIVVNGKKFYAHRLAWLFHYGDYQSGIIDHINGNKTDNRICNLRDVSYSTNGLNRHNQANNKSGSIGVSFSNTRNRWVARIVRNRIVTHIGYFTKKEDAISAYESKKIEILSAY